jgi:outer membrane protein assembly factor BamD
VKPRAASVNLAAILCLAFGLAVVPGCGKSLDYVKNMFGFGSKADPLASLNPEEAAASLAIQAQEELDADDYADAAKLYQQLKDQYPYSRYAVLAELRLGDAYFLDGKYIEADGAYKTFVDMRPDNDAIPYALYQQGMCNYMTINGVDHDQTPAILTIQILGNLVETYPDSKYASMAKARIAEAQNSLAGHEFYIGEFYYNRKDYRAAMNRFEGLIAHYPDSGYHQRAFNYIAEYRDLVARGEIEEGNQRPGEYDSPFTVTDVNDTRY